MEVMTQGTDPFRWWEIRGVVKPVPEIPGPEWSGWEARYDNDAERGKRTTRAVASLPGVSDVFVPLLSDWYQSLWSEWLGYPVEQDFTLHGGGLHVTSPGGRLGTHLDYDRHPLIPGKRRALNLIAFLNPEWRPEWGGALQLCDPTGRVVREILPEPGKLVAFEVSDLSYHGVGRVAADCPVERATAAVYLLSDATPANTRVRAMFLPSRAI